MNKEFSSNLIILITCFCILAGALILEPSDSQTSSVRLGQFFLPNVCTFQGITGLPCPGCGLTRSIVAAMHGDLAMSLRYHRLGLVTTGYILLQFVFCLGLLAIPAHRTRISRFNKFLNRGIIVLAIFFGVNWIFTLLF